MKLSTRFAPAACALALLAGCHDSTGPGDVTPPASPRGLYSVTGDHEVFLKWLPNTEADLNGYRIYAAECAGGPGCLYERIAVTTGTEFVVRDLPNGVTRYFAVAAVDLAGNESRLSRDDVFDTPRPEGFGLDLDNYLETPASSGYDFSAGLVRAYDHPSTDVFFGSNNGVAMMFTAFTDTDIQDAGYASSLDAIDFSPPPGLGWSPSGSSELVLDHCYIVHTGDDHYAKFRVTALGPHAVELDWAYQVDPGNRELGARRVHDSAPRVRRAIRWRA